MISFRDKFCVYFYANIATSCKDCNCLFFQVRNRQSIRTSPHLVFRAFPQVFRGNGTDGKVASARHDTQRKPSTLLILIYYIVSFFICQEVSFKKLRILQGMFFFWRESFGFFGFFLGFAPFSGNNPAKCPCKREKLDFPKGRFSARNAFICNAFSQ